MKFNNKDNPCIESTDGKKYYHSRSVAVCAIIYDMYGKVLVTKRADTVAHKPGEWCMPCGYLDWNETIQEALVREIYEEVGIDIIKLEAEITMIGVNDNPGKDDHQNITFRFVVKLPVDARGFILNPNNEVQAHRWIVPHTLMHYDDNASPIVEIINGVATGSQFAFNHLGIIKSRIQKGIGNQWIYKDFLDEVPPSDIFVR